MKTYAATVNLDEKAQFSVPKANLLAPEVEVLRTLWGHESVIDIQEAAPPEDWAFMDRLSMSGAQIRAWLTEEYGPALKSAGKTLTDIFGGTAVPLPKEVEGAMPAKSRKAAIVVSPRKAAVVPVVDPSAIATSLPESETANLGVE